MPRSQKCASTCIKQSIFSRGYIDFDSRSCSLYTCVNNQANHAERCFIHRPVNAPRQDAKFLIRREIWLSTGSNRVGRLAENRYSSEIVNGIARLAFGTFFLTSTILSMQLHDYVRYSDNYVIYLTQNDFVTCSIPDSSENKDGNGGRYMLFSFLKLFEFLFWKL